MNEHARRDELKNFLRTRRERLSPIEFGFRDTTRRRTPGLRRDEVAQLANIGTTTYTFLEQGRDINVSTNVLDKVSDVLRLSEEEKRHFFKLAVGDLPSVKAVAEEPEPALLTMLQNMGACPAFILNYKFDVVASNELTARVFNFPASGSALEQNLLWRLFNVETRKQYYENYDDYKRCVLAYFRLTYTNNVGNEELSELIQALKNSSEEFVADWSEHEVFDSTMLSTLIKINHPRLGRLEGHYVLLSIFGYPNFTLCVFSPDATTDTPAKLAQALKD
jgi:hypothetical protein